MVEPDLVQMDHKKLHFHELKVAHRRSMDRSKRSDSSRFAETYMDDSWPDSGRLRYTVYAGVGIIEARCRTNQPIVVIAAAEK